MGIAFWTDTRIERLKVLYDSGDSCSQIAADLGNISRNAVIGKVHRLGLARRGVNGNYKGNGRSAGAPKTVAMFRPKPRPAPPPVVICRSASEIVPLNLTVLDLMPGDCRFPYGDSVLVFCGHPKFPGSSYCPGHFNLTRRQDEKKRDGIPAKMPINLADGRRGRSVLA